jgi:excisionase family DNA binding protein
VAGFRPAAAAHRQVAGITADGGREVLGLDVGESEDEVFWRGFLSALKRHGLTGGRFVTFDQHAGLVAGLKHSFQGGAHQRCRVHFAPATCWRTCPRRTPTWSPPCSARSSPNRGRDRRLEAARRVSGRTVGGRAFGARQPVGILQYCSSATTRSRLFPRRLIAERRIRFVRVGRHIRIPESAIGEFIAAGTVQPITSADVS